jgi:hypothetical protein
MANGWCPQMPADVRWRPEKIRAGIALKAAQSGLQVLVARLVRAAGGRVLRTSSTAWLNKRKELGKKRHKR